MKGASTTRLHVVGLRSKLLRYEPEGSGFLTRSWPHFLRHHSGALAFLM